MQQSEQLQIDAAARGASASSGGLSLADKPTRDACFASRDIFFACSEKNGRASCGQLRDAFVKQCPEKWRTFFEDQHRRTMLRNNLLNDNRLSIAQQDAELARKTNTVFPSTENTFA